MAEVHPEWHGELTPDKWIVTSFSDRGLRIWRGVEESEVQSADKVEVYDPAAEATRIRFGESEAVVRTKWVQDRLVATITPVDGSQPFTREIYREAHWLVIADTRGGSGIFRWYFVKT